MKFIEITNDAGAVIEIPDHQINFIAKQPLEREFMLALVGAAMKVNGAATTFEHMKEKMLESDTNFVKFPIPEGTEALVNPKNILFITSIELTITTLMFSGGLKLVVKEGINTVRSKLTDTSEIQVDWL
jgi:uncharacterized protein YlzI (FlbEa/FlbD family)